MIGVETKFSVIAVVKGTLINTPLVLHHYRPDRMTVPNGPEFLEFKPQERRTLRLWLVREADGRYAPVTGQTDPDLSVRKETISR